jgi:hypothetical protein
VGEGRLSEGVLQLLADRELLGVHQAPVRRLVQPAGPVVARCERAVVDGEVDGGEGVTGERGDVGEAGRVGG